MTPRWKSLGWAGIRGTLTVLVTLFGLLVLTFAIGRVMPVDPARLLVGQDADQAAYEQAVTRLGLDRPVPEQFFRYVGDLLRGDFGVSVDISFF